MVAAFLQKKKKENGKKKDHLGESLEVQSKGSAAFIYLFIYLFFKFLFIYLFIYLWLCWVFVSVRGLSLVAASRGHSSSQCAGPLTVAASLVAEHRLQTRRLSNCGSRA